MAWSYVAAVAAALITGIGFAIADAVQASSCGDGDVVCALGVYTVGGLIAALIATSAVAIAFRFGWEWWLICASVIVSMPNLLDLLGPLAWLALVVAPGVAAALTWSGHGRARWRAAVIAGVCIVVMAWSLIWTFFPPGLE